MGRRNNSHIYGHLLILAAGLAASGCSGRPDDQDFSQTSKNETTPRSGEAPSADAIVKNGGAALSLLSPPPSETSLSSFVTGIDAPSDVSYRFALVHAEAAACENWSEYRPVSDLLKLDLGSDGPKTLCLQQKDKNNVARDAVVVPFRKRAAPEDGPEYTLAGRPAAFTAGSAARILVNSGDAVQYRAAFINGTACSTLENLSWQGLETPFEARYRYDGVWSLCLDVRDRFGNRNRKPHVHTWTRDTIRPVMDELPLPGGVTQSEELTFTIKGAQVFEYKHALLDGVSDCANPMYSAYVAAATPLKVELKSDGIKTLCVLTRSEAGIIQASPYVKVIQKVKLKASVKIQPIAVTRSGSSTIPVNNVRRFVISGAGLTHYKAVTLDRSDNCDAQRPPSSAPISTSTVLEASFSPGGIKTVCVWGYAVASQTNQVSQPVPTYVRFHNDGNNHTAIGNTSLAPFVWLETGAVCVRCHDGFSEDVYRSNAVNISNRLRDRNHPRPMPVGGWASDEQRTRMLLFLQNIPGYPQDLPHIP